MKKSQLAGIWRLVSWENRNEKGHVSYPLGSDAKGYISYSEDGYVFVHIMATDRHFFSTDDIFGGKPDEIVKGATSHISYCGRYELEADHVVHKVEICSFPNWIGSYQRRHFEFKDGNLLLSAQGVRTGAGQVDAYLVWEPVES